MVWRNTKKGKQIASLRDALNALFDIWYAVKEEKEKVEQILFCVNKVLNRDVSASDKALAYYIRGAIYFKQERFCEAEQDLRKALTLDEKLGGPRSCANTHVWLAYMYEQKGELENAVKICQDGIRRLQNFYDSDCVTDLFYTLAKEYIWHRDATPSTTKDAVLCLYQGLKMDRNFESYKFGEAFFLLGYIRECDQVLYDSKKAIKWYEQFLQLTSDDAYGGYYKEFRRYAQEALKRLKDERKY